MLFHDPKFWLAISFCIFLVLFVKYALPLILKSLDDKSLQISKDLREAEEMRKKAQNLLEEAQKYYDESVKYSQQLIHDANLESDKIMKDTKANFENEVKKKLEAAEERIKVNEERIIREIKTRIVKSAIDSIQSNVDRIADEKAMNSALKNSISQISSKLVN